MPLIAAEIRRLADELFNSAEFNRTQEDASHYLALANSWRELADSVEWLDELTPEDLDTIRHLRIRQRAYLLWIASGRPRGETACHWEQARGEIEAEERSGEPPDPTILQ